MGDDPARSMVDRYGRAHQVPNLYLVGGGSFPICAPDNPTETLQTLAFWTGEAITREVERGGALTRDTARLHRDE